MEYKYIIIDVEDVTNFSKVRQAVATQMKGSFIFGDIGQCFLPGITHINYRVFWKTFFFMNITMFLNN